VKVDAFEHFEVAVRFMDACRLNHSLSFEAAKLRKICVSLQTLQNDIDYGFQTSL
jgi:hypothetical protein